MRLASGGHVVVGLVELQQAPHDLDVVAGKAPVAPGIEVAEPQLVIASGSDPRDAVAHLALDELEPAPRRPVVEQDAVGRVQPVALAVVQGDPVPYTLAAPYGERGWNGVVSVCGTSRTLPNTSDELAW